MAVSTDYVGRIWGITLYIGTASAADDLCQYTVPVDCRVVNAQFSAAVCKSTGGALSLENKTDSTDIVASTALTAAFTPAEGTLVSTAASRVLTDGEVLSLNCETTGNMSGVICQVELLGI